MSQDAPQTPPADQAKEALDIRPVVAEGGKSYAVPIFIAGLVIAAVFLFSALDANRRGLAAPTTTAPAATLTEVESRVPALFVPPERIEEIEPVTNEIEDEPASQPAEPPLFEDFVPYAPPSLPPPPSAEQGPQQLTPGNATIGSVLVYDRGGNRALATGTTVAQQGAQAAGQQSDAGEQRVRAARLSNPSTTVIQGTVIPAVLETAIDTNRSGPARAIVSRDIFGFDGTRILIPRGSRLIGEYGTGLNAGQNRVLVEWTRLVRPDGATIALDSPSADRLGRAGIRGDVDSHFWERFASAIFRTALDVGTVLATQQIGDGAFVVFPQNLREAGNEGTAPQRFQRTLSVDQGTAVSVFVARDLDFTPVERGQ